MSLPTILRSSDGAIDVPYEVISEKNTFNEEAKRNLL
jgi:hypothetical protein